MGVRGLPPQLCCATLASSEPRPVCKNGHLEVSKADVDAQSPHQRSRQAYYVLQPHAWPTGAHQLGIRYNLSVPKAPGNALSTPRARSNATRQLCVERAAAVMNDSRVPAGSRIRCTVARGGRPSSETRPLRSVWLAVSPEGVLFRLFSPLPKGARLPGICPGAGWGRVSALRSVSDSLWLPEQSLIRPPDRPCTAWWCIVMALPACLMAAACDSAGRKASTRNAAGETCPKWFPHPQCSPGVRG